MSDGRWFLRESVAGYSSSTLVTRRGEPRNDEVEVSPWGEPDVVLTVRSDQIIRRRSRGGANRPPRPESTSRPKHHLVFATPQVIREATRLLPERTIENAIEDALRAGKVTRARGGDMRVLLPNGIVVLLARTTSPVSSRKSWLAVAIDQDRRAA